MSSFALYDGKSAFYAMDGNDPKVIVLDMQNSEDGDLLRKVKALHPNTEVLVLAGHEADKYRDTYLDLGAFAYLNKPVNTADLSETIRAASEKSRSYAH